MKIQIRLPEAVQYILHTLEEAGFEAYAVGGCIRDVIMGREPNDWDITTSANPVEVKRLFRKTIDTGIKHGTVTIMIKRTGYEVTTYRVDGEYRDGRHPENVLFTSSLEEDLERRDFTVNAMAYNEKRGLVDLFGGVQDISAKCIRCVGPAEQRFTEDALRMMRAIRFSAQFGYEIEESTRTAICRLAPNLQKISAERIQAELVKLITSPHPEMLRTAYETGITGMILPEFDLCMKTPQNNPHHCYSVGEHIIQSMKEIRPDRILRLTMLFHDIGKPSMKSTDDNGVDHFRNHAQTGAETARKIMQRLKFDNETIRRVCRFVQYHDWQIHAEESSIRKVISKIGEDAFPEMFEVNEADISAQNPGCKEEKLIKLNRLKEAYTLIRKNGDCLSLKTLQVSGEDLNRCGIGQGTEIGSILKNMLSDVLEQPEHNHKEYLLNHLGSYRGSIRGRD